MSTKTPSASRLQFFPVPLFATVMGLGGFSLALEAAGLDNFGLMMLVISTLVMLFISGAYALKMLKHFAAVKQEFNHPVRHAFFPAFSISLLILSIGYLPFAPNASLVLWFIGAVLQFMLTLHILSTWIFHDKFEITMINPAWFIPVVGNVLVPIAGVAHVPAQVSWFYLSYGMFFWVILQTIMLYRIIFHSPLPEKLLPTLFIMIAPPAVSFLSYVKLTGHVDAFAQFLFSTALFVTLLLFYQTPRFVRVPFALSWWAYSFPVAAMTIACFKMAQLTEQVWLSTFGWGMMAVLTAVIVLLMVKTIQAMLGGKVCVPE